MTKTFETSIVVPAYNEEKRLPSTLDDLACRIRERSLGPVHVKEVIVVDDGSIDQTALVAQSFKYELPSLKVITVSPNRGKGFAVRQGLINAVAEWILIADADMSTPWEEVRKLALRCQEEDAVMAIGSRDVVGSQITRHQSALRESMGKSFNILVRIFTKLPFKDTQCGFKFFKRSAIQSILARLEVDRFAWDVEFLFLAQKRGGKILEVPVVWEHKDASQVRMFRDSWNMAYTVLKLRLRGLKEF